MAKKKQSRTFAKDIKNAETASQKDMIATLQDLQANFDLWYKVRVLLHDLSNVATDRAAEARTLCTTDELYISDPYFTAEEAALIKATTVSPPILKEIPEFEALELEGGETKEAGQEKSIPERMAIEEAIKSCLENFFEKGKRAGMQGHVALTTWPLFIE